MEALVVDTGTAKWVTLRRWGDVHAGGESCARAGEGVTLEKFNFTIINLQMY